MKRLIAALFAALMFAGVAEARVDIRQNSDGTASIVGSTGDAYGCLGGVAVPATVNLNSLSTDYVVSPITNARIKFIRSVQDGTTTGTNAEISFWVNQTSTPMRFIDYSTGNVTRAGLFHGPGSAGASQTISSVSVVGEADQIEFDTLEAGHYVAVQSNGAATGAVSATVFLTFCPR